MAHTSANRLDGISWARKLKLRHLEVFLAVDETGSLTAAAAQLHMTQPALSHWLSDLEDSVGLPLFLRNRKLTLTVEGEVLRQHALRMLRDVHRTDQELQAVKSGRQGRLHIGSGMPRVLLPRAIVRLHETWPDIFVHVEEAPFSALLGMLANRQVDLVIGALGAPAHNSGFAIESLFGAHVHVVARVGHPCRSRADPSDWEELLDHPWILPPPGAEMRKTFDDAFASRHLKPPLPCIEAGSSIRAQLLAAERNYLSILLGAEVQLYSPLGLQSIALDPGIAFPDIGVIWDSQRPNPIVAHFLDVLRLEAAETRASMP